MLDNKQLEEKLLRLEKKLETRQQLQYPVDIQTQSIINAKKIKFEAEQTGVGTETLTLRVSIDGKIYKLNARL